MEDERFDEILEEIKDMDIADLEYLCEKVNHEIALREEENKK